MGHNHGVVRDLYHVHEEGGHGKLVDPSGRSHPVRLYDKLLVKEPQTCGLRHDHDQEPDKQMNVHRRGKHVPQTHRVSTPELECQEALGGGGHAVVEESEHSHHTPDNIVDTVVAHTKDIQHDAGSVQSHQQNEYHPDIQKHGIPGYSPVVCDSVIRHTLWPKWRWISRFLPFKQQIYNP